MSAIDVLPARIAHADWGSSPAKRVVAVAELRHGLYVMRSPRTVGQRGGLLRRLHSGAGRREPTLLGFDFCLGVPRAYAERAGIENFAAWLRARDPDSELFAVAGSVGDVSLARPFFPRYVAAKRPGLKQAHRDALGLSSAQSLRRCERAHCWRGPAAEMFWALGPQAVGKATVTGWRELVHPALTQRRRRYGVWPFDGALGELLAGCDAVIVEAYPAEAYRQLGLRTGSRAWAKTRQADRQAEAGRLLDRCRHNGVVVEAELARELEDGFGRSAAGEDRFDAVVGLLAMIQTVRAGTEPERPDDPAVTSQEGWIFGQHATCVVDPAPR